MFGGALWAAVAAARAADQRDDALADLATARGRVVELESGIATRDSMLAVLAGPDVRTSTLAATGTDPQLRLFLRESTPTILVTAFGLPQAPGGRTYQLWGIRGAEAPVSIGTFDTDATGSGVVLLSTGAATFDIGAVTEEPAGGSPQPTSQPFLVGSWPGASGQ